jgi:hypothetical protein
MKHTPELKYSKETFTMEAFKGGRGKTLSNSDRVYRQDRAAKILNMSHDTLSKAKQRCTKPSSP